MREALRDKRMMQLRPRWYELELRGRWRLGIVPDEHIAWAQAAFHAGWMVGAEVGYLDHGGDRRIADALVAPASPAVN